MKKRIDIDKRLQKIRGACLWRGNDYGFEFRLCIQFFPQGVEEEGGFGVDQ